jgi:hypothetical protein
MSVNDSNGWGEVERKARQFEWHNQEEVLEVLNQIKITTEDRLRGAIVESLSLLECGHATAAYQVLADSLKIGGVK